MALCADNNVLWPDEEHIDVQCAMVEGHAGRHVDEDLFACWEDYDYPYLHCDHCTHPVPTPKDGTNS